MNTIWQVRIGMVAALGFVIFLPWRLIGADAQAEPSQSPRSFAGEVAVYIPPRVDRHSPGLLLGGLKNAQEGYRQQQVLLERDLALETAISRGEHPPVPADYTSSQSRFPLLEQ